MQVERLCDERSRDASLAGARRSLLLVNERLRRKEKIPEKDRRLLSNAMETIRRATRGDERCHNQIADVEDYVDDNLMAK
jgi:hypothetical protein